STAIGEGQTETTLSDLFSDDSLLFDIQDLLETTTFTDEEKKRLQEMTEDHPEDEDQNKT
ncbi:MAG: hypothetical protein AAF570_23300, partial [Bacteroidota bacterium]